MRLAICTKRLVIPFIGFSFAVVTTIAAQTPALAQDAVPDSPTQAAPSQTDGRIIYSRDVSYGSAIGPRTPGQEHSVNAGPTDLLLDSLGAGLEPIGDDESASISAGTNSQAGLIGSQVALGMSALSSMSGADGTSSNIGDIQSSAIGGAIGQATGAINNAMGSVRGALDGALGGGQ